MPAPYRVGIIASGRIAREHARGWQECEHTQIVAIADSHPQALAEFGHDCGIIPRYLVLWEMFFFFQAEDGIRDQRASHQQSKAEARRYLLEVEARVARDKIGIPEPVKDISVA